MTNLTPNEQQELEAFIQQNFSQEDFAKLVAITALMLKIDIQGLSLKEGAQKVAEAISNLAPSAFNSKLVDALMPKDKQGVTTEGGQSLEKALARKAKKIVSPVDKLSQLLFDKRKQRLSLGAGINHKAMLRPIINIEKTVLLKISFYRNFHYHRLT